MFKDLKFYWRNRRRMKYGRSGGGGDADFAGEEVVHEANPLLFVLLKIGVKREHRSVYTLKALTNTHLFFRVLRRRNFQLFEVGQANRKNGAPDSLYSLASIFPRRSSQARRRRLSRWESVSLCVGMSAFCSRLFLVRSGHCIGTANRSRRAPLAPPSEQRTIKPQYGRLALRGRTGLRAWRNRACAFQPGTG